MPKISSLRSLVAILCALTASDSRALQTVPPSLEMIVLGADVVAKVRVTQRSTVKFQFGGTSHSCGTVFGAEVIESVKGPAGAVEFFLRDDANFDGSRNLAYLVFLTTAESSAPNLHPDVPPTYEEALLRCRTEARGRSLVVEPIAFIHRNDREVAAGDEERLVASPLNLVFGMEMDAGHPVDWRRAREMIEGVSAPPRRP